MALVFKTLLFWIVWITAFFEIERKGSIFVSANATITTSELATGPQRADTSTTTLTPGIQPTPQSKASHQTTKSPTSISTSKPSTKNQPLISSSKKRPSATPTAKPSSRTYGSPTVLTSLAFSSAATSTNNTRTIQPMTQSPRASPRPMTKTSLLTNTHTVSISMPNTSSQAKNVLQTKLETGPTSPISKSTSPITTSMPSSVQTKNLKANTKNGTALLSESTTTSQTTTTTQSKTKSIKTTPKTPLSFTSTMANLLKEPNVVIEPKASTQEKYDNITISCQITNVGKAYLPGNESLKWCFANGSEISAVDEYGKLNQTYSFQVLSSVIMHCGLNNCSTATTTSTITMKPKKVDLSVNITSSPFIMGDTGYLTCHFKFAFANIEWKNATFMWTKDGVILKETNFTRRNQCHNSICESRLEIKTVDLQSEGNYTCEAVLREFDFDGTGTTNALVKVWEKPKVMIKPEMGTHEKYDNITISCQITNVGKAYLPGNESLKWCFANGSEISAANETAVLNQTYSFQVLSSVIIHCGINNCSTARKTSNITMVAKHIDLPVQITSSPFILGDTAHVTCSFKFAFFNLKWSNASFIWTKDGLSLNNTIFTEKKQCHSTICESQLQVTSVDQESKGNYTCEAVLQELDFDGTGTTNALVKVWEKPNVVINPEMSSQEKYDNISIRCQITNVDEAYLVGIENMKWCFANDSQIIGVNDTDALNQTYSFQVLSSVIIHCGINNCSTARKSSNITMVAKHLNLSLAIHETRLIEGKSGYITCFFNLMQSINLLSANVTFDWTKDDVALQSTTNLTIFHSCNGAHCDSRILLSHINIQSEGKYVCDVSLNQYDLIGKGSAYKHVEVKENPYVVMEPIAASVEKGENVEIRCYVRNIDKVYHKANESLRWCSSDKKEIVAEKNDSFHMSFLLKVQSTVTIKCGINNCSSGKSSRINMVEIGKVLCKKDGDWPSSLVGQQAQIPCPTGYTGTQTRKCNRNGKWEANNADKCRQQELEKVENIIKGKEDISDSTVQNSLDTITDVVNSTDVNNSVSHINIKQSVDLISAISNKNITFKNRETADKATQKFAGVVSKLLNVDEAKVNQASGEKKENLKSKIISSVDGFAKSVTKTLKENETVTVDKKNLYLTIERVKKQKIVFPKNASKVQNTKFELPEEALSGLGSTVAFTAVKYDDFGADFEFEHTGKKNISVDSSVLSLTIEKLKDTTLHPNITLTFQRKSKNESKSSSDCVFLKLDSDKWSDEGCSVNFTNSSLTVCTCNHLTNFAILMSLSDDLYVVSRKDYERLRMISIIGCSLSIIGAFITIIIYLYFWRFIKSRRSTLVVHLCIALCVAYLMFLTAVEHTENKIGCVVIAALLHYFFLAMFCIMLCLGIDLAVAILDVFNSRSSSTVFYLLGWGLPAVIVGITLGGSQLDGYGDERYCWLRDSSLYGFIVPVLCIISVNLIIVIVVMRMMYTSAFMAKKSLREKTISGVRGMCALLPILGLTWVFGILSINEDLIFFQYLFAIFNSLQGLFIFLFHVVLNYQVRQAVAQKIKQYESRTSFTKSSKSKYVSNSSSEGVLNSNSEEPVVSNKYDIPRINFKPQIKNTQL